MKISTTANEVVLAITDDAGNSVLSYSYSDFNLNVDVGNLVLAFVELVGQIEKGESSDLAIAIKQALATAKAA